MNTAGRQNHPASSHAFTESEGHDKPNMGKRLFRMHPVTPAIAIQLPRLTQAEENLSQPVPAGEFMKQKLWLKM